MSDKYFLDTNILVYAHTDVDITKQSIAQQLIATLPTHISTQVIQELSNIAFKKLKYPWEKVREVLEDVSTNNTVFINTYETIKKATYIAEQYKFSFYDSLIIAAALTCQCQILYSEDMQDGQVIEGTLTVKNPFM
ncbi:MAG TPA: PIN domain-containing protein [Saprospiraceae bacterium]|nr:PIN domain-containing protein [Saprospiraceae bacterium]HMP15259.1 PIN domain-containing protein [Saprospiraceae bacterium]